MTTRITSVPDESAVGEARRNVHALAMAAGLGEPHAQRAVLIASEIASNLAKHAGEGDVLARRLAAPGRRGIELLGVDRGPGMPDVAACLRDGFSRAGSAGTGFGAIRRLADVFDVWSEPGNGTVVLAQVWDAPAPPVAGAFVAGAVSTCAPGESVCGDRWMVIERPGGCLIAVVDGVGHGPGAADAAMRALETLARRQAGSPREVLDDVHHALRATRGAAMSVADVDAAGGIVRFAGVGNVTGAIVGPARQRHMVAHHGTLGHHVRAVHEFSYPRSPGDLLLLLSDGLQTKWSLGRYPGATARHPSVVAALLHRDFRRSRDDATVVVAREGG